MVTEEGDKTVSVCGGADLNRGAVEVKDIGGWAVGLLLTGLCGRGVGEVICLAAARAVTQRLVGEHDRRTRALEELRHRGVGQRKPAQRVGRIGGHGQNPSRCGKKCFTDGSCSQACRARLSAGARR